MRILLMFDCFILNSKQLTIAFSSICLSHFVIIDTVCLLNADE